MAKSHMTNTCRVRQEMRQIRKSNLLRALNNTMSMVTPRAVVFAIFVLYAARTGSLGETHFCLSGCE